MEEEKPKRKSNDKRTYQDRKEYLMAYQKERYNTDPYYRHYILDYGSKYREKNKEILKEKMKKYYSNPEVRARCLARQRDYYQRVTKPKKNKIKKDS